MITVTILPNKNSLPDAITKHLFMFLEIIQEKIPLGNFKTAGKINMDIKYHRKALTNQGFSMIRNTLFSRILHLFFLKQYIIL
jgi:hypothetical protein